MVGFPGLAQGDAESSDPPATGSVVAFDNGFRDGSQADPQDSSVEIAAGGRVTFSYPTGAAGNTHNVKFTDAQPASCTQTAGVVITTGPPLPSFAQPAGWSGYCDFTTPGTYSFLCNTHPTMTGSIVVTAVATPTPTPTGTATPTPTPTATATPTPTPTATATPAASIEAHDNFFSNKDVAVAPGDTVHFSYPQGSSSHNVEFHSASQPVCTQTAGVAITNGPPLPAFVQPPGWAGDCRFDSPGVYSFVCSAHNEMTGSVTVGTVAQATPTPVATEPPRDGNPAPKAKAWASLDKPASRKLGVLLQGRLKLTARCTSVDGGTVTLSVSKAVAKKLKLKATTLATGRSRCDRNGRFTVTLKPTAAAKKALARSRKSFKVTATLLFSGVAAKQTITLSGGA